MRKLEDTDMKMEYLSPASCEMQSVERVFSVMKSRVYRVMQDMDADELKKFKLPELKEEIRKVARAFEPDMALRLCTANRKDIKKHIDFG